MDTDANHAIAAFIHDPSVVKWMAICVEIVVPVLHLPVRFLIHSFDIQSQSAIHIERVFDRSFDYDIEGGLAKTPPLDAVLLFVSGVVPRTVYTAAIAITGRWANSAAMSCVNASRRESPIDASHENFPLRCLSLE